MAAGTAEPQRRALTGSDHGDAASLAAEAVVIGLALDAGKIPPRLAAGEQVVLLDTGGDGGQPLVDTASVTALATDGAGAVRVGLEVPTSTAGIVAAAGAQDRLALARLPMA